MKSHLATDKFWRAYSALPPQIRSLADKNFELLKADPKHPSLHFKQIGPLWSVRVGRGYRALAVYEEDSFVCFWVGNHNDYERLLK